MQSDKPARTFKIKISRLLTFFYIAFYFCGFSMASGDYLWKKTQTRHFTLYWRNCGDQFLNSLKDKSENYYWQLCDKLNLWHQQWEGKIYIYDSKEDYQAFTHAAPWAGGHADFQNKSLNSFSEAPKFLTNILPHELAHLILNEYLQGKIIPLCLQEGIAQYIEQNDPRVKPQAILRQLKQEKKWIPLDTLFMIDSATLQKMKSEQVTVFYAESAALIDSLIQKHGKFNFSVFLKELKNNQSLKSALSWAFHYSGITELNEECLREL